MIISSTSVTSTTSRQGKSTFLSRFVLFKQTIFEPSIREEQNYYATIAFFKRASLYRVHFCMSGFESQLDYLVTLKQARVTIWFKRSFATLPIIPPVNDTTSMIPLWPSKRPNNCQSNNFSEPSCHSSVQSSACSMYSEKFPLSTTLFLSCQPKIISQRRW